MALGAGAVIAGTLGSLLNGNSTSNSASSAIEDNWSDSNSWGSSFQEAANQANSMSWNSAEDTYNANSTARSWTEAEAANLIAHKEAELNRMFQTYMSNSAYQRAVLDLKAAGLNPILAYYGGGSGATTPTGATAQTYMNQYSTSDSSARSYGYSRGGSRSSSSGYSRGGSTQGSTSHSEGHGSSSSTSQTLKGLSQLFNGIGDMMQENTAKYGQNWLNPNQYGGQTNYYY